MSKRIAFIDHQLGNYHSNKYSQLLSNELAHEGFTLAACTSKDHDSGKLWATKNNVSYHSSVEELQGEVDAAIILAPNNPETHLHLLERAVSLQVPLYVDKTFAPDRATALKMFAIAEKAGVPIFTTSALRYAAETKLLLDQVSDEPIWEVQVYGGGRNYEDYAIHPVEWVISTLGTQVTEVRKSQSGPLHTTTLLFAGGQRADIHLYPNAETAYHLTVATASHLRRAEVVSPIFELLLKEILDFFRTQIPPVSPEETLAVRQILDLAAGPSATQRLVVDEIRSS